MGGDSTGRYADDLAVAEADNFAPTEPQAGAWKGELLDTPGELEK